MLQFVHSSNNQVRFMNVPECIVEHQHLEWVSALEIEDLQGNNIITTQQDFLVLCPAWFENWEWDEWKTCFSSIEPKCKSIRSEEPMKKQQIYNYFWSGNRWFHLNYWVWCIYIFVLFYISHECNVKFHFASYLMLRVQLFWIRFRSKYPIS